MQVSQSLVLTFFILQTSYLFSTVLAESEREGGLRNLWNNFWKVSCEFSGVVSRSRRSVPEVPSWEQPQDVFKYLYPLAHLTQDDLKDEGAGARSHSVSGWVDDLVDLWQSECHDRRKRDTYESYYPEEESGSDGYAGHEHRGDTENMDTMENYNNASMSSSSSSSTGTKTDDGSASAASKLTTDAPKDDDGFFASYGGDIEYFFPLISFGIPFDGEITFLGFHGFKGLFPYK